MQIRLRKKKFIVKESPAPLRKGLTPKTIYRPEVGILIIFFDFTDPLRKGLTPKHEYRPFKGRYRRFLITLFLKSVFFLKVCLKKYWI